MKNSAGDSFITVTDDDIKYAEKILLQEGLHFDEEERIPIIKNFSESIDVNACPGSGKTTVLLAKLIILSRKLPLNNGRGVCVITHTNVAVDEIKNRLGNKGEALFKYPNFVGTIQQFIDKFLAIPFFKNRSGINVKSIDDDVYYDTIKKVFKGAWPKSRRMMANSVENGYYNKKPFEENMSSFISKRHIGFVDKQYFIIKDNKGNEVKRTLNYYDELMKVMFDYTFYKGILRYEDAIALGEEYLNRYPQLVSYFQYRFKYIFIDEMQDTKKNHQNIFNKIFSPDKVVLQRFGDINQNLGEGTGNEECGWDLRLKLMPINSSKRYGEELVKFISPLRVKKDGELIGNIDVNTIAPNIIVFNSNNIERVESKFFSILKEYGINEINTEKIKIIGKVGRQVPSPYISIKSYINIYNKQNSGKTLSIKKCIKLKQSKDLKEFYDNLISILILEIKVDSKRINRDVFKKLCEVEYQNELIFFKSKMLNWYKNINAEFSEILSSIYKESVKFLRKIKEIEVHEENLKKYFIYEEAVTSELISEENIKEKYDESKINTVFSSKGETHLATLYLESYLNTSYGDRSDISRILDYMLDKKEEVDNCDEEALTSAYVAMSRAKRLTCIAIQYGTIKGRIKEFSDYGYLIRGCDEKMDILIKDEIEEKEYVSVL